MTATAERPDVDSAEQQAEQAAAAADALRQRITQGHKVTGSELAAAESEERIADLRVQAAHMADRERREQEAADQLRRARAAMQAEYADAATEPPELRELRESAAVAAADYLAAAGDREDYLRDLNQRAADLGFRVGHTPDYTPSHLPKLAAAILRAATGRCPQHWTTPRMDRHRGEMWGD